MQLKLTKSLDHVGILLSAKKFIGDCIDVICDEDGVLTVGLGSCRTIDGRIKILDYMIPQGPNKVSFISSDGIEYHCGIIHRNNRFISIENPIDDLTVKLVMAVEAQEKMIANINKKLTRLEKEFGINIMEDN